MPCPVPVRHFLRSTPYRRLTVFLYYADIQWRAGSNMGDQPIRRRLAAILAADVAGYTRLMEQDTDGTVAAWSAARDEVIEPAIAGHSGRLIKLTGDGFLVEFPTVQDAVNCALAMQSGLATSTLRFRMGVTLGDIVDDGRDIHGEGVNVAARLESLAEPGGICVSGMVYESIRNRVAAIYEDRGKQQVKNVSAPVRVYGIRPAAPDTGTEAVPEAGPESARPIEIPGERPSIAVLPFNNMSNDEEQEYFSDGITEDIITDLSKVSALFVIARNSSFVYKGRSVDITEAARELGVRYVLEGSVRKAGNRVRVNAQLIDGGNGGHLWAERYDRGLDDIFVVQDELTREIVSALSVRLTAEEQDQLTHKRVVPVDAYELFLRGREQSFLHTKRGNIEARNLLDRAIDIAPDYAAAHARIAFTQVIDYVNGWSEDPARSLETGLDRARQAVAMDEDEPQAQFAVAIAWLWNRELDKALGAATRCLELAPSSAEGHLATAHIQIFSGNPAAAIETIDAYQRLDPLYPDIVLQFLAEARISLGEFEAAVSALQQRIERDPESPSSYTLLACCYGHLGRFSEAREAWEMVGKLDSSFSIDRRRRVLPFKDPADFEYRIDGLRRAGIMD